MELFCALLTGFFLWLFSFHWERSSLARAREAAGALLIEGPAMYDWVRTTRGRRWPYFVALVLFLYLLDWLSLPSADVLAACLTGCLLTIVVPPFCNNAPLELREHGVIHRRRRRGSLVFTSWDEIAGCKWCDKMPEDYVPARRLLLQCGALSAEEVEAITAVAGRFVPVYGVGGKLIAGEEAGERTADAILPKCESRGLRFQFNLQSLMLLMVVVSCAASCYGIHYRSLQAQREAIAQLGVFLSNVDYNRSGDVRLVDFKACKVKPGDSDLVHLEGLRGLEHLNLDGSPITDAGLKHLYPIKTLTMVSLLNTQVTQQGVDDLKRELPNAFILPSPPLRTPVAGPPAGGQ
jgi:hypothetical protein